MSFLAKSLATLPHDAESQRTVLAAIWGPSVTAAEMQRSRGSYESYMQHVYSDICRIACAGIDSVSSFSHQELLDVCTLLFDANSTQASVLQTMGGSSPERERLVRAAAAIVVPLNISGIGGARPGKPVGWDQYQSLAELFSTSIEPVTIPLPLIQPDESTSAQLSTRFHARNLEHVAGFIIIWTSTITDHLRVVEIDDSIKIYLFHQVGLLEKHQHVVDPIIPEDLILETYETLALLIPKRNPDVKKWFNKLQKQYHLDPGAGGCDHLPLEYRSLDHFHHWKARLKIIKDLYDCKEPSSPIQVWRDRRKPVQWWTFWIAVLVLTLTIVFGLIQSVTGILQVIYAH